MDPYTKLANTTQKAIIHWDDLVESFTEKSFLVKKDVFNAFTKNFNKHYDFLSTFEISTNLRKVIMHNSSVFHYTSYPVLRLYLNERITLAVFTFIYSIDDLETEMFDRPTRISYADLYNGQLIAEHYTSDDEFSKASYDLKYSFHYADNELVLPRDHYTDTYRLFDSVRSKMRKGKEFDRFQYLNYLDMISSTMPEGYRRFYNELSSPIPLLQAASIP